MVRIRLIRRRRRSGESAASSARPMASPIRSARPRMFEVMVYGGFSVMLLAATHMPGRYSPSGSSSHTESPCRNSSAVATDARRKLCSNLLHNFRPDPPAAKGQRQLCNSLLHNLAARRRPGSPGHRVSGCHGTRGPQRPRRRPRSVPDHRRIHPGTSRPRAPRFQPELTKCAQAFYARALPGPYRAWSCLIRVSTRRRTSSLIGVCFSLCSMIFGSISSSSHRSAMYLRSFSRPAT